MSAADPFAYSAVIATKDRPGEALEAARLVLEQDPRPLRVVIVDASTPALAVDHATKGAYAAAGVELVVAHRPPSTSAQRNHGIALVETPLVLLLDDDIRLDRRYVSTLLDRWAGHGFAALGGAVGSMEGAFAAPALADRIFRELLLLHLFDPRAPATRFRPSQKLRFALPAGDVVVPATSTAAVLFRTDLARRHPFDERFGGYVLGEDVDMSARVARSAPILQVAAARCVHLGGPAEARSAQHWHNRGRQDAFFRLRRLERGVIPHVAFGLSVVGELVGAAAAAARSRRAAPVTGYLGGLVAAAREARGERHG